MEQVHLNCIRSVCNNYYQRARHASNKVLAPSVLAITSTAKTIFAKIEFYLTKRKETVFARGVREPHNELVEVDKPRPSQFIYQLPLEHREGVVITQGPLNNGEKIRTHGYLSCLYAIDFASQHNLPAANVVAAREGTVIHLNDMGIQNGAIRNADPTGDGFGNWIALGHEGGEVSFYAHLNEVKVKRGEKVNVRQKIGVEGASGQAGCRHLHFSVHRPKSTQDEIYPPYYSYFYETLPYRLAFANEAGEKKNIDIQKFAKIDHPLPHSGLPKLFPSQR
jgi:murein DD-endopeptidase MepM/ murein hydrolase activator NlpD